MPLFQSGVFLGYVQKGIGDLETDLVVWKRTWWFGSNQKLWWNLAVNKTRMDRNQSSQSTKCSLKVFNWHNGYQQKKTSNNYIYDWPNPDHHDEHDSCHNWRFLGNSWKVTEDGNLGFVGQDCTLTVCWRCITVQQFQNCKKIEKKCLKTRFFG